MFDIGSFRAKTCDGVSRRAFLKVGASLPLAYGLPSLARPAEVAASPRAKSVVFIWLWGAPSHLDTFDPKPDAPVEYRGPYSTIATRTPGVRYTDLIPQMAQRSHLYTLVRTHVTSAPGHPDAGTVSFTGFEEKPVPVKPNFGSIVAKHRGHRGDLPPFVSVGRGIPMDASRIVEGYGGGSLGKQYDPFLVNCAETGEVNIPALKLLDGLNPLRISDRRTLLREIDDARRELDQARIENWNRSYQQAYGMLTNPSARDAFDLTREPQAVRDKYGFTTFGQSALLTRRLVEAGVPYIQLNWSQYVEAITPNCDFGWDTHIYNFELLQDRHCPVLERAVPAFLDEMYERGLMKDTLVVMMGEFGRTPKINNRAARDHWPPCYFSIWAGAGIEPGRVIGESDKLGEHPITDRYTPLMVGTTIAHLAGIDTQARAEMNVLPGGELIEPLI